MIWGNADKLYIIWIIPVICILIIYHAVRKKRMLKKIAEQDMIHVLLRYTRPGRTFVKHILVVTALCLMIVSYLRPRYGVHAEIVKRSGTNIYFALDNSKSMWTSDVPPNRFLKARHEIKTLVKLLEGNNRMGLVTFSGDAYIRCPLTTDASALMMILDSVSIIPPPPPGTSLRSVFEKCLVAFDRAKVKNLPVIVLLTDGEETVESLEDILKKVKELNIKLFIIGIGTTEGAPIPDLEQGKGYVHDISGNVVVSHLNQEALTDISNAAGGIYYSTTIGEAEARDIAKEISNMSKEEIESKRWVLYDEKYYVFLIFAVFCLALEMILSNRKPTETVSS